MSRIIVLVTIVSVMISSPVPMFLGYWGRTEIKQVGKKTRTPPDFPGRVYYPASTSGSSIADIVERVNDAVVSVIVTKDVPIYERYYESYNPWGIWGGFSIPRVRERGTEEREVGGGSGFIVSADGLVVTNRHVVDDREARYSVLTNQGKAYDAEVLARDSQLDIAVLRINSSGTLPYLEFGSSEDLRLGESVIAIGNALFEFRNSVSVGVISGLARSIVATDSRGRSEQLDQVIQTDAAINPGNSGGPLLNLQGQVIGVNVATSRGADNIGFALPSHVVAPVITSVKETGKIVRPYLGVRYTVVTKRLQELNNLPVDYGFLLVRGETNSELAVMPGSPADKAGLQENDIITAIDGEEMRDKDLATWLRTKRAGDSIEIKVLSRGLEKTLNLELAETPTQ